MNRVFSAFLCVLFLSSCSWLSSGQANGDKASLEEGDTASSANTDKKVDEELDEEVDNEPKSLSSIDDTVKIKKVWRESVGNNDDVYLATLHPAVLEGNAYAASNQGRVSAWSVEKGKRLWRTDLELPLTGGVGVGAGLVTVGSSKGELIALDAASGEERWRVSLSSEILSAPAAKDDLVVVQTQDGKLYGLSVTDGKELWRYTDEIPVLTLRGTAAPLITNRMVVTGFASGKLVALNPTTGTPLWEVKLATGEGKTELEKMVDVNTPVMGNEVVYASSYQGRLGAFSRGTGRELWAQKSSSYHAPAFNAGRLFVADANDQVIRLRTSGGRTQWTNTDLLRRGLTAPLAIADYVLVADSEGYLHVLSQIDGTIIGRTKVESDGISAAMVTDGENVFVQDNEGDLTAYRLIAK